jgi:hypothetical protein
MAIPYFANTSLMTPLQNETAVKGDPLEFNDLRSITPVLLPQSVLNIVCGLVVKRHRPTPFRQRPGPGLLHPQQPPWLYHATCARHPVLQAVQTKHLEKLSSGDKAFATC